MNWCFSSRIDFVMNSRSAPWIAQGRCGGKSIYFFVYPCSYLKLGDLSTSLEMTVLFLVVISTKWNAWRNPLRRSSIYPPLSFYPHKLQRLCFLIHSFHLSPLHHFLIYSLILISPKALSNSAIQLSVFSPTSQLSLLIVFIIFLFIYRCYNMLYL